MPHSPYATWPFASRTTTSSVGSVRRAAEAADMPAAPPPITTSRLDMTATLGAPSGSGHVLHH